ncbi:hypothetical protein THOM_0972 [Trachipleistophora hominis]|uniref:Uncharacterized protein n=1 Tax=Trachipleistophora hominis TaxID=72359 RepID=L7JZ71_TRAHO|nr:hypothetical protein THOM_0972 [Trachipleistophora hominis]
MKRIDRSTKIQRYHVSQNQRFIIKTQVDESRYVRMSSMCNDVIYLIALKVESNSPRLYGRNRLDQAVHSRMVRIARMKISKRKIEKHLGKRIPISLLKERNIYRNECCDYRKFYGIVESILKHKNNYYGTMVCNGFSSKLMPAAVKLHFFLRKRLLAAILNK